MQLLKLDEQLKNNSYPGRGIVVGVTPDAKKAVFGYFIMGRSENSRNRIFVSEGECMRTEAFDPSKLSDPSLIIYSPVRVLGEKTIVTNGDQTDTVYDFLAEGKTFADALRTREFEPDAPNYTPRISALGTVKDGKFSYKLSILKSSLGIGDSCERFFWEYDAPLAGEGRFIHTYKCDGNPIPSFEGDPEPVEIDGDIDSFTNMLWENLNEENKVSLFVRFIDIASGEADTRIINKNQ